MKKAAILLALLCFIVHSAQAQRSIFQRPPKDSTPFNNRLYKQEIGIDAWGLLWGGSASNLVWKIRDDRSKLVPVTYSRYWRFQAQLSGFNNPGFKDSVLLESDKGSVLLELDRYSYLNNEVLLMLGRERNNFYGRFNFYTGWDIGLSGAYSRVNDNRNVIISQKDGTVIGSSYYSYAGYAARTTTLGVHAYGFAGIKYHFSDRISISLEAALGLQYYLSRRKSRLQVDQEEQVLTAPVVYHHYLNSRLDYLRLFTLNYHFKKY